MTTDTTVKYFDSTMSGASELSDVAGSLITLLDACLVNGFGGVTLDNLVITDGVATATKTGHGLAMMGNTGPVVKIEGATPSGLNGEWRIASVPDINTFTFAVSGITNQTATGTITAKRAPAGFSKAFSGTNKAAYRADSLQSNRLFLRVDDTLTTYALIRGFEAMSDVDVGTGLFPTDAQLNGGGQCYKANSTNRPWLLVSDGLAIYLIIDSAGNNQWRGGLMFGDIVSYAPVDAYGTVFIVQPFWNTILNPLRLLSNTTGSYLARAHTQAGGSVISARYSHAKSVSAVGEGVQVYPSPVDGGLHLWPIDCWDTINNVARGLMPGAWNPLHLPIEDGFIESIAGLPGRTIRICSISTTKIALDVTGPWR